MVMSLAGLVSPMMSELKETLYQFERPFVADSSDFERTFGMSPTLFRESLQATLDWVASQNSVQPARSPVLA